MTDLKILFITDSYPNYMPDLLLHGLRKLLGPAVVDYPRKDSLYMGALMGVSSDDQLCPNLFPPDENIDREDIQTKINKGYFNYVICDHRAISFLQDLLTQWPNGLVLIDGEDHPMRITPGPYVICRRESDGTDFSIPLPMAMPEEILQWITSYDNNPKTYSVGFLGSVAAFYDERRIIVENIARFFPDSLLRTSVVPTEDNPNPTGVLGRNDYYANLQKCRIVLTLRGAGYDTFRFWENAACNAVHISQKMPLFIPKDFEDGKQILRFADIDELRRQIDNVLARKIDARAISREGRNHLMNFHMTTNRAVYLLDKLNDIF